MRLPWSVVLLGLTAVGAAPAQPKGKGPDISDKALAPWVTQAGLLTGDEQVTAVAQKLADLNPDYQGQKLDAVIQGGVVKELKLPALYLRDIRPVMVFRGLEKLDAQGNPGRESKIADLACLAGMKLQVLKIQHTAVADLSPLKGMPIHTLSCQDTKVRDISVLKGLPLERLSLPKGVPAAQVDQLKGKVFRHFSGHELGLTEKRMRAVFAAAELEYFHDTTDPALTTLDPLRGMPLKYVIVSNSRLKSLGPLAGAKDLTHLEIAHTPVEDVSPLRGLPITTLNLEGCRGVTDLAPLVGEKPQLVRLQIGDTGITDLTAIGMQTKLVRLTAGNLRGVKTLKPLASLKSLDTLFMTGTVPEDKDYSPLVALPVRVINVDLNPMTIPALKQMPKLETVNGRKAADVLK